ncbi:hypothetical protein SFRURICE_016738 [Spodoptera frugiperda]|nr:hypothetical protein SFRURICE_016738 [Spodoptera frugiperda]
MLYERRTGAKADKVWADSTGVIPRPNREPTCNNACVVFRCVSDVISEALLPAITIFPIPQQPFGDKPLIYRLCSWADRTLPARGPYAASSRAPQLQLKTTTVHWPLTIGIFV